MSQLLQDIRSFVHNLAGTVGYGALIFGVLMLLWPMLFGERVQSQKVVRAIVLIGLGALLMQFANG